jgi:putative DNA primase/helicase
MAAPAVLPIEVSTFDGSLLQSWLDSDVAPDVIGAAIAHAGVELRQFDTALEAVADSPTRDQVRMAFLLEASAMPRLLPGVHRGQDLSHRRVRNFIEDVYAGRRLADLTNDEVRHVADAYSELGMPLQYLLSMLPDDLEEDQVWFFMYRFLNAYGGDECLTDGASARRLVALNGDNVRYCSEQGWLIWNGLQWQRDSEATIVIRMAKKVAATWDRDSEIVQRAAVVAPDDEAHKAMMKRASMLWSYAKTSDSVGKVNNTVRWAQTEAEVHVSSGELDADPMLLNVENGTVDLRTGALRPHEREDYITRLSPVVYDPLATSPLLSGFLDQATGGDEELQEYLQRIVGYSITGDTGDELLFYLYGPGASGKSTLVEAIKAMLGSDYAKTADFSTFLKKSMVSSGPSPEIARLAHARVIISIEVDEGGQLAQATVKSLTGGDTIAARHLFKEHFEFKPAMKLWLVANHLPRVDGTDDASFRRIRVVPFLNVVPEGERDPTVKRDLCDPAVGGPALLAYAVQGCLKWQQLGLPQGDDLPRAVREATEEYRKANDAVGDFLEECCVTGSEHSVTSEALYVTYKNWCERWGEHPMSQKRLAGKLKTRGFTNRKERGDRSWFGLALTSPLSSFDRPPLGPGRPVLTAG